jgi:uncharacterized protein
MSNLQTKFLAPSEGDHDGAIAGYGAVFGNTDRQGDTIAPGAFAASLASGRSVAMLWQHDQARPIGVWDSVTEDARGLRVKGRIVTETETGRDALALLRHGALNGLSIGYRATKTYRGENGGRVITEAELWEVSLVTFPANEAATVTAIKANSQADVARALKAAGFTNRAAEKIASGGFPALRGDTFNETQFTELAAMLRAAAKNMKGETNAR